MACLARKPADHAQRKPRDDRMDSFADDGERGESTRQAGLWHVTTLIQGAGRAETNLICVTEEIAWVRVVAPTLGSGACTAPAPRIGPVNVTGSCFGGGGLKITGMLQPDHFDLVARRWGWAGFNPDARAAATTQGMLISPDCGARLVGERS
ncbi:hypothetical protein MZO42_08695 [Sphingomonas psychrotolerans]|uniref:Uncharacterized protein n=1 Tax=Sphingomonas psychrotolerans TaxID=1327635 RepID=A0ABU3N2J7_9SPHN|nr:hypothetical protein [Sphingomonas psychrotolerans]MDT8758775.1 hypothetical protein [Sphingomonas psychrotolerans]